VQRFVDNIDELGFVSGGSILDESQKSILLSRMTRNETGFLRAPNKSVVFEWNAFRLAVVVGKITFTPIESLRTSTLDSPPFAAIL
jgi:hypothetical protein